MTVRETATRRRLVRVAGPAVISPAVSSPPGVAMTSAGTLRTEVYTLV